jgi:hypothetical protein
VVQVTTVDYNFHIDRCTCIHCCCLSRQGGGVYNCSAMFCAGMALAAACEPLPPCRLPQPGCGAALRDHILDVRQWHACSPHACLCVQAAWDLQLPAPAALMTCSSYPVCHPAVGGCAARG